MRTSAQTIGQRLAIVRQEIAHACQRSGRSPDTVHVVAVSKTHSAQTIAEAVRAGAAHLGENRIEEALAKMPEVAHLITEPVYWHLIGHVQSRKARYVSQQFALFHALDSVHLAERISRVLVEQGQTLGVLLEINISGEATKQGWAAYNWQNNTTLRRVLWDEISRVIALPGLVVRGLMTMAPIVAEAEAARPVFRGLHQLREALAHDFPQTSWTELSMGMSDDYPVAVEEGATLVRVGRAIFGERPTV